MSETTRTKITATPQYPGSFFPEEGRPVELPSDDPHTAITTVGDDGSWFALDVRTTTEKLWTDGDGGELWRTDAEISRYRIYVGEAFTADDIERLDDGQDYRTLLSNMRGNGWARVVRTRRGNFQPVEPGDVVVDAGRLQPASGAR